MALDLVALKYNSPFKEVQKLHDRTTRIRLANRLPPESVESTSGALRTVGSSKACHGKPAGLAGGVEDLSVATRTLRQEPSSRACHGPRRRQRAAMVVTANTALTHGIRDATLHWRRCESAALEHAPGRLDGVPASSLPPLSITGPVVALLNGGSSRHGVHVDLVEDLREHSLCPRQ